MKFEWDGNKNLVNIRKHGIDFSDAIGQAYEDMQDYDPREAKIVNPFKQAQLDDDDEMGKCKECGEDIDLFPGYLIASDSRHPKNVFVCPACG